MNMHAAFQVMEFLIRIMMIIVTVGESCIYGSNSRLVGSQKSQTEYYIQICQFDVIFYK